MIRPAIHLTNFASRSLHRGTVYTIMRRPRRWELGAGRVEALTPDSMALDELQRGQIGVDEYRRRFEEQLSARDLSPGALSWWRPDGGGQLGGPVGDGDTLCCACGRERAGRAECHRVWAAHTLARTGWRVVLDGVEVIG